MIVYKIKVLLFWLIYFFFFRAVKKVHENDDIFDTVPALAVRQKLRSSLSRTSETSALPRIWPLEESYRCIHMSNLLL